MGTHKSEIQGEVVTEEDEEEEEVWPPGKMEDRALGGEEQVVRERREELMPTAQQRPPPPLRAERSTGKELRSRGPRGGGFKFKATVSVCFLTVAPHPLSILTLLFGTTTAPPHHHLLPSIKSEAAHKLAIVSLLPYQGHIEAIR